MIQCENLLYSRAGHRWQNCAYALYAGYLRLNMPRIYNTYSFSTATLLARNNLNITLYEHFLSHFLIISFLASATQAICNTEISIT